MFISRKRYNELIAERDKLEHLAFRTMEINDKLMKDNRELADVVKAVQESKAKLIRDIFKAVKGKSYTLKGAKVVYYGSIKSLEKIFYRAYSIKEESENEDNTDKRD